MKELFSHPINRFASYAAMGNLVIGNLVFLLRLIFEPGFFWVFGITYLVVASVLMAFTSFALLVNLLGSPMDIKEHLVPIFLCLLNGVAILLYIQFLI